MKFILPLFLFASILVSCGNSETPKVNGSEVSEEENSENRTLPKNDDRVSGFFKVTVDGKDYNSEQLQDNYCDMSFNFAGEKSFVAIRFKDVKSKDALIFNIYGPEDFIADPAGTLNAFMFTPGAKQKINVQFLPGDSMGSMSSITMIEGEVNISQFSEGQIKATFNGKGAKPTDVVTKKNLVPIEGEIELKTTNITKIGNKGD
ncbi:hypothetical protein [Portibacter marinus]|uniref:hypothetical protein n=1 Tax=Portibacter marinus TaxID=2898660 RepID=UPI001F3BC95D|nr:hypothetical protein [Portibacter marinus]